METMQLINRNK